MSLARIDNEVTLWNDNNLISEIKKIYGRDLNEGEFRTFVELGRATGLNPFLREIWAVKYGSSAAQIFVGRDGYRKSAQSNPDYDYHQVDAVYSNDDFDFDLCKGEIKHKYNLKDRGRLIGAYCLVKKRKSSKPIFCYVDLNEYNTGKGIWTGKPATMIKKVAEAQGLRMAFQELFAGTYDESENWNKTPVNKVYDEIKVNIDNFNSIDEYLLEISQSVTLDELQEVFKDAYKKVIPLKNKEILAKLINAKDKKKEELMLSYEVNVIDGETGEIV